MKSNNIDFSEYSDDEQELIQKGYIAAMRDVADGCFEVIGELDPEEKDDSDICSDCGSEMVQQMGSERRICLECRG